MKRHEGPVQAGEAGEAGEGVMSEAGLILELVCWALAGIGLVNGLDEDHPIVGRMFGIGVALGLYIFGRGVLALVAQLCAACGG